MSEDVLVIDIGSGSVKVGYAGEDSPAYILPSRVCRHVKPSTLSSTLDLSDQSTRERPIPASVIERGVIKEWDLVEQLFATLFDVIGLTTLDHLSLFIVDSVRWTVEDRTKLAQCLFERFSPASIAFSNSATTSVIATGGGTGLAVECGSGLTTITPVFEGLALRHAITILEYAGDDVSNALRNQFLERGHSIDMNGSTIVKEKLVYVSGFSSMELEHTTRDKVSFALPDGDDITVDTKMFRDCTENLFSQVSGSTTGGLVGHVYQSLLLCDISIREDLAKNIILSGGTTMIPGFGDRLSKDLIACLHADNDYRINSLAPLTRVNPSSFYKDRGYTHQRRYASWIGASMLATFDTYHRTIKVSKQEWEDHGSHIFAIKGI